MNARELPQGCALCFAFHHVFTLNANRSPGTHVAATVGTRNWNALVNADADRPMGKNQPDIDTRDAELLAAALQDRTAFALLYHRYIASVFDYCRRRLDEHDAEDATSHIFMQALGKLETCRGPSFRAWLFTIAHNVVIDQLRKRKPTVVLDDSFELRSNERSPEDHALDTDCNQRLEQAIRALPPDQRAAVELRLAGLTGIECALVLGKSPEATRMLQHRAFVTLRRLLDDLGPEARS
jgi:RNA polymerase sigma-70 factor (ECF subfamily)